MKTKAVSGGIESIMVEINKKLFMDTESFKKTAGFTRLKSDLDLVLKRIADWAREAVATRRVP